MRFKSADSQDWLVALGASAGGPVALETLLSQLPRGFPAAILVAQHVDAGFIPGLVDWLNRKSALPVRIAIDGDAPLPGTVLIAGRNAHLGFTGPNRLEYTCQPAESAYRPSVDVLFRSILQHWHGKVAAVLLTGMGHDGAEGLCSLKARGHYTIAQDQCSSAVYGMPKAASDLDAATEVLALDQIALHLSAAVTGNGLFFTSPLLHIN
jgi:chemotaxis response regulator CheB